MLSFFSIFGIQNNKNRGDQSNLVVVNCFHFSVSLGYKTTNIVTGRVWSWLWIAFIFQYLWDTKQLYTVIVLGCISCELLSFFSIFGIQNNFWRFIFFLIPVVNCFHFSVSLGYKTTVPRAIGFIGALWIAFIFQYLWDTKQPKYLPTMQTKCCELLSFFSIFGIQNNIKENRKKKSLVVNCFHFSVSLGYKTTLQLVRFNVLSLWIAFIFQYLWDTKQPLTKKAKKGNSCELLSFFSIFGIQNNNWPSSCFLEHVVNCFHFSVSLGYKTTETSPCRRLWSCELLSFFSIFGIQNNGVKRDWQVKFVVNCFHFSVSLGYKTTKIANEVLAGLLWIAFIFQYLWDTKQRFIIPTCPWFCCELLSFFSIFGIQNNYFQMYNQLILVVNCFHFSVSLGYKTTIRNNIPISNSCELLSFFSIFGIQNNHHKYLFLVNLVVNCFHFSVSLGYKTTINNRTLPK